jgi:hypothetical protein
MTERDNPQAFPTGDHTHGGHDGMTLRDWFAGQALGSIPLRNWDTDSKSPRQVVEQWASCAYAIADAMLAAREGGAS